MALSVRPHPHLPVFVRDQTVCGYLRLSVFVSLNFVTKTTPLPCFVFSILYHADICPILKESNVFFCSILSSDYCEMFYSHLRTNLEFVKLFSPLWCLRTSWNWNISKIFTEKVQLNVNLGRDMKKRSDITKQWKCKP